MPRVEVLVLEGAMASGVAITFDMLDAANRLLAQTGSSRRFNVAVSGSGARKLEAFVGSTRASSAPGPPVDVLVVPGLGLTDRSAIEEGLSSRAASLARRRICQVSEAGGNVAASCSATFLLASAGLLDGRRATTTWWLAPIFQQMFPRVALDADATVVIDGPVTTAGAAMAQIDLMLTLIARHAGPSVADGCARFMLLDGRGSQARYARLSLLAAPDERIARAEAWARARLEAGIDVGHLAAAAGLTPRTFARRLRRVTGLSPVRFLQRMRVEEASDLVRSTRLSIDEIARRVGYAEASTLRRLLRRDGRNARSMRAMADQEDRATPV